MAERPMISVAGIRAVIGKSLIPPEFLRFLLAFATMIKGKKVVVGGDARPSRHMLRHLTFAGLIASGYEVIDLSICPTPTVGLMIKELKADGGIAITASHNPIEWNAYKFFNRQGVFITKQQNKELMKFFARGRFHYASVDKLGQVIEYPHAIERHITKILKVANRRLISRHRFKVVADCCNGAGSVIVPRLLKKLACQAIIINTDMNKPFPHPAEPLPENLGQLCRAVKRHKADIGFALDPDADRLAIINEKGEPIGEDRTLTLVAHEFLKTRRTPIVVNLCTTRAIDDVAAMYGVKIYHAPIGEANVVEQMFRVKSQLGGEGNGGVIIPRIHPGRDAATGIAFFLQALGTSRLTVSELNQQVPDYKIIKTKFKSSKIDIPKSLKAIESHFRRQASAIDKRDGIKVIFKDSWFQFRPSGTEPIVRLFAEAASKTAAQNLSQKVKSLLYRNS